MATPPEVEKLPVADLHFDRENPRLAEYGVTPKATDDEILAILWDAMDVSELVQSIAASGFFTHEPLVVAKEAGKNIVIEGNADPHLVTRIARWTKAAKQTVPVNEAKQRRRRRTGKAGKSSKQD